MLPALNKYWLIDWLYALASIYDILYMNYDRQNID